VGEHSRQAVCGERTHRWARAATAARIGACSDQRSGAPLVLGAASEPASLDPTLHPARDPRHDIRRVLARESPHGMKGGPAPFHRAHPVQHERMDVDVEIEGAAEGAE